MKTDNNYGALALAGWRKMIPFVIFKRKSLHKERPSSGIIFMCNERGQMREIVVA
jgi:hypothetical protein